MAARQKRGEMTECTSEGDEISGCHLVDTCQRNSFYVEMVILMTRCDSGNKQMGLAAGR